jgi:hypothetical protein
VTISRKVGSQLLVTMFVLANFVMGKEKTLLYQLCFNLAQHTILKWDKNSMFRAKSREPHIIAPSHIQHWGAK